MNDRTKLLFIDDEPAILQSLERNLFSMRKRWDMEFISDPRKALSVLKNCGNALVVTDWMMPDLNGLDLCERIRDMEANRNSGYCYIILLTGKNDFESVIAALEKGADEFLTKPFDVRELKARISVGERIVKLQERLSKANEKLETLAKIDPLTSLCNRRHGDEVLSCELQRVARGKQALTVVLIDLDKFKEINDTHGHEAGDVVLCEVARRLHETCRAYDTIIRWGGDEILLVLPDTNAESALIVAERVRSAINSKGIEVALSTILNVTSSIGVATAEKGSIDISSKSLVRAADKALYLSKEAGRNCVRTANYDS